MSILFDIANELDRYPRDETSVQIINVAKVGDSDDEDVNQREVWEFNVKLTNNGHLNMTNVSLHILGLNGTRVREEPDDDWVEGMVVGDLNPLGGAESSTSRKFQFKAPDAELPAGTQLLHTHVEEWDAEDGFNHFFSNHTKSDTQAEELGIFYPRAFHSAQVHPR